jgi:hypothetical protein
MEGGRVETRGDAEVIAVTQDQFQSRRVRREDPPVPVLTGRCVVEDSTHPTTTTAAPSWRVRRPRLGLVPRLLDRA